MFGDAAVEIGLFPCDLPDHLEHLGDRDRLMLIPQLDLQDGPVIKLGININLIIGAVSAEAVAGFLNLPVLRVGLHQVLQVFFLVQAGFHFHPFPA